jgi:predicted porin
LAEEWRPSPYFNKLGELQMQKKIIALAIAAAFSAPAFADTANVTVYGDVKMAVESIKVGDTVNTSNTGYGANKISSNVTKLGFKGAEDLGDGLSAIWQIEQQIDIDNSATGNSTFATRNSFLGLKDNAMGTVLLGKYDTPYKLATRSLDPFDSTIADNRSLTGGVGAKSAVVGFDGRQPSLLAYMSPSMGGLTISAAQVFGAEDATAATNSVRGSASSIAAVYSADALFASAAYEVHNFGTGGSGTLGATGSAVAGTKESAVKLGLGFTMAALALGAEVERTSDDIALAGSDNNKFGHTAYSVFAKFNLSSSNAVKVAYSHVGETNNNGTSKNDAANQVSVGFDHNLSKRTSVFALYTTIRNDDGASYGLTSAGSTGGGANATGGAGSKVEAFALGMKHVF